MKVNDWLSVGAFFLSLAYFGLMCIGLVLASVFLWAGLIDSGVWGDVCGILFGVGGVSHGLSQGMASIGKRQGAGRSVVEVHDGKP